MLFPISCFHLFIMPWMPDCCLDLSQHFVQIVINNIPMSILFTSVLNDGGLSLYSPLAIYSAIIGSNIGAFFSPIGALAGVMLMKILKDKGAGLSALSFIRYCAPVATVSLVVSVLVLIPIL